MPPKTVSIARSHISLILIHYLTNAKKNCFVVYNPDSITSEKNLFAKKHNVLCSYSAL